MHISTFKMKERDFNYEESARLFFKNWLKEKGLSPYAEVLPQDEAKRLFRKLINSFVDFSFINILKKEYGSSEINKLTVEQLVGSPQNHFKKNLITLTETYWISGYGPTNEEAHKKRVREILLHKKSLMGKKVYWHMCQDEDICRLNYDDLEKFIDKSEASDEYYVFDDSFTWCLTVNHEYYIIVCGDLLEKK